MKKMKYAMMLAGLGAAMCLSTNNGLAQQDNGGRPDWRSLRDMTPEQRQAFFLDRAKERLEITDESEWNAIKPLVQKVLDARREAMADTGFGGGFGGFGGRRGGGGGGGEGEAGQRRGGGGGMFGTPSPERETLDKAVESKAPKAEVKAALAKFLEARKAKEAALTQAQENLRKVLNSRQEAIAVLAGWL